MSTPPPGDLNAWTREALVSEVQRLRAVALEMATPVSEGDPRAGSHEDTIVDVAGDPYARGGAIFDARNAVLLDAMDVLLVDTKRPTDSVQMLMVLKGRVNYSHDRTEHSYLFNTDGAAAIVSEILGLASRARRGGANGHAFATGFKDELDRRLEEMP